MDTLRVLIVDDEEELASALRDRLGLRGWDARAVTGGAGALEELETGPWDVVLLDVKMPGLGGMELARAIRERYPGTQVVLMTGRSSAQEAREGETLDVFDYLIKPVPIDRLTAVLRAAVGHGRGEAPPEPNPRKEEGGP